MVRLINSSNIKHVTSFVYSILHIQEYFTHIVEVDNPRISPCIYVMWHGNQFSVYGLSNKNNVNILISNSLDGEIVSQVAQNMGFQTCRGSSLRKGSVSSTLKMISKLKNGEDIVITVDGPRGPLHTVKPGAIVLAREANVPIVPMHWYSDNSTFVRFNSWDKMSSPIGPCRIINLYGEPIYVDNKSDEEVVNEIKTSLFNLEKIAPNKYKEAKKLKLWSKKRN